MFRNVVLKDFSLSECNLNQIIVKAWASCVTVTILNSWYIIYPLQMSKILNKEK